MNAVDHPCLLRIGSSAKWFSSSLYCFIPSSHGPEGPIISSQFAAAHVKLFERQATTPWPMSNNLLVLSSEYGHIRPYIIQGEKKGGVSITAASVLGSPGTDTSNIYPITLYCSSFHFLFHHPYRTLLNSGP